MGKFHGLQFFPVGKNPFFASFAAPRVVAVTADRRPPLAASNASNVNSSLFGVYDSPTMLPRTPLAPGKDFDRELQDRGDFSFLSKFYL